MSAASKEEYKEQERARQIEASRAASQAKQRSLSSIYGQGLADKKIGIVGYILIFTLLISNIFFIALWILSYFQKTKDLVEVVMNYLT